MGRDIYVVLNGKAGRRSLDFSISEIEKCFKEHDPDVNVEFGITERPMHAAELAREAAGTGKYYAVVCAGGDGTVNEVANGLAHSGARMGLIPNGSTNVFAMEMKIPADIPEATRIVLEGVPVRVDVGKVNDRYYIWMLGIGIEAKIAHLVNPNIKKYVGVLAYVIAALSQAFDRTRQLMRIIMDDDKEMTLSTFNTIIGNATSFDGFLGIKSRYSIKDGFLDVCVYQHKSWLGILGLVRRFITGRRDYYRSIDRFSAAHCRVKKMRIETVPNAYYHIDGEVMGMTPIEVEVHHKALTFIMTEHTAGKQETELWKRLSREEKNAPLPNVE
ncbi:MAG TPA: diacylglycerol kinase family lipid kinase [bacterium]|nr:diacylglycerol kinase family lipid kinase [bacterium]